MQPAVIGPGFSQRLAQTESKPQTGERESNNRLDWVVRAEHLARRKVSTTKDEEELELP